jgi:hypothetical protein
MAAFVPPNMDTLNRTYCARMPTCAEQALNVIYIGISLWQFDKIMPD